MRPLRALYQRDSLRLSALSRSSRARVICLWLTLAMSIGWLLPSVSLAELAPEAKSQGESQKAPSRVVSAQELRWTLASESREQGADLRVYVETEKRPGNPAFRIETDFDVAPDVAAATLMNEMIGSTEMPKGQTRTVLERRDREVIVQTLVELPMMFSDREVAVRIRHSDDKQTGVHRVDFKDANEVLPPATKGVVRLNGTDGYWEFRPIGEGKTHATYVTRASVGGSIPAALGDRLLKAQAVDSVADLRDQIARSARPSVAAPPKP